MANQSSPPPAAPRLGAPCKTGISSGRLRGAPDLVPLPPWRWIAERVTDACIGVGGALWLLSGALGALGRALSNLFRRGGGG